MRKWVSIETLDKIIPKYEKLVHQIIYPLMK